MGDTVVIEKTHLATLMRRANLHGSEQPQHDVRAPLDSVTVPRQYLEDLKKSLREYNALRSALIRGGVTVESLDLLVQETFDPALAEQGVSTDGGVPLFDGHSGLPASLMPSRPSANYLGNGYHNYGNLNSPTWNFETPSAENGRNGFSRRAPNERAVDYGAVGPDHYSDHNHNAAGISGGHGKRTLYFTKLPDRITYAQIFSVIRGGAIVDVWMKSSDHAASVSFVDCSAAENFYQYARKNDIYIEGKRINIDWREPSRQFVILNNIMSAISRGATRNLLLSKVPPTLTEARIHEDLDHIHNLHVEKIETRGGSILVNLNSVCVALFARTCLMSRSSYKGIKIEFAADECAGRLPTPQRKDFERKKAPEKAVPKNRFDILAITEDEGDEKENGEADDDDDLSSDDGTEKENSPVANVNGATNSRATNGHGYRDRRKHPVNSGRGGRRAWGDAPNGYH